MSKTSNVATTLSDGLGDIFFSAEDEASHNDVPASYAQTIADEFKAYLDEWHAIDDQLSRDDELDAQIHAWYLDVLKRPNISPKGTPYFSPSSANSCKRELYEKLIGSKRDSRGTPPHQGRWRRLGTVMGDMIQRDVLFAERHYERLTGKPSRFAFVRNDDGTPLFEDFAKRLVPIEHSGQSFSLFGTCDGIMTYTAPNGKTIRVGLEIKSKQTTYSQTSPYTLRNGAKTDHVKQAICYGIMYEVDVYIVLYVNASKKAWNLSDDDYAKNPDIAAFGIGITDLDRRTLLDDLADVMAAVTDRRPPALNIDKITFNNYLEACVTSMTQSELDEIERQVTAITTSSLPDAKKRDAATAWRRITELRQYAKTRLDAKKEAIV